MKTLQQFDAEITAAVIKWARLIKASTPVLFAEIDRIAREMKESDVSTEAAIGLLEKATKLMDAQLEGLGK